MIVVMKPGSSQKQIEHVIGLVREMGLKEHVIVGTELTVVAVIGNDRLKDRSVLEIPSEAIWVSFKEIDLIKPYVTALAA